MYLENISYLYKMKDKINLTDLKNCLDALHQGQTILYPTDTIWGLGCDATNEEAVKEVIRIKGRDSNKNFIILLHNENQLASYTNEIPDIAYQLIEYADKPLTIVFSGAKNLAPSIIAKDGSVGIRIVKHEFCSRLLQRFRKPILSTSANISGQPSASNFDNIDPIILDQVGYVVEYGQNTYENNTASTIIKLEEDGTFHFIRK